MNQDKRRIITAFISISLLAYCYMGCAGSNRTYVPPPPANATPASDYETYNPPIKLYVKGNSVNIRSGPGTEHAVIATEKKGQQITVHGKKDDWYYTQLKNSKDGYILASLLSEVKPVITAETSTTTTAFDFGGATTTIFPEETPPGNDGQGLTTTAPPTPAPPSPAKTAGLKPGNAKVNSLSATKVRSSASPFAKITGELTTGTQVEIMEVTGNWCLIKAGATEGYVTSNSLIQ